MILFFSELLLQEPGFSVLEELESLEEEVKVHLAFAFFFIFILKTRCWLVSVMDPGFCH